MENTLANKEKFFAQYWGQKVMKQDYPKLQNWTFEPDGFIRSMSDSFYLQLKPLQSISDEDAEYCIGKKECSLRINDPDHGDYSMSPSGIFLNSMVVSDSFYIDKYNLDYLRSKGYALPWMGLSVEKQIEYGWTKLEQ